MSGACPPHHRRPDRRRCFGGGSRFVRNFSVSVFRLLCLHQIYHFAAVWFNQHRHPRGGGGLWWLPFPSSGPSILVISQPLVVGLWLAVDF
ncbi:hypothetical protein A2U01_0056646, partial [Trifolium medium]|nr:hypothetical protein [Trifolium medium]